MSAVFEIFTKIYKNNKICGSFFSAMFTMLVAHGFNYFNSTFANDRIAFFGDPTYGTENSGKWFVQFYVWIRGYSYLPWFDGILSIIYVTFAVYVTVRVLKIQRKLSYLIIAGLYATDASVITANFYGASDFLFAFAMACLSVLIWNFGNDDRDRGDILDIYVFNKAWVRIIFGMIPLILCIGVYGAYASVAPTLVILSCFVMLIDGDDVMYIFKRGVEYIVTFGAGLAVYYIVLRLFLAIRGTQMASYLGEDRLINGMSPEEITETGGILGFIKDAYRYTICDWLGNYSGYVAMPKLMAIVLLITGISLCIVHLILRREEIMDRGRVIMLAFLIGVFPLSCGLIYVMAFGTVHYLMKFSFVYLYVVTAKLAELNYCSDLHLFKDKVMVACGRVFSTIAILLLCAFVFRGMLVSNMAYNGMEMKYTWSKSIATRLINRIETVDGYEGTEDVCLVGHIMDGDYFKNSMGATYWRGKLAGLGVSTESTSFSHIGITPWFLQNIMGFQRPISIYNETMFSYEDNVLIEKMSVFPADGCVEKMGDVIIVKLAGNY